MRIGSIAASLVLAMSLSWGTGADAASLSITGEFIGSNGAVPLSNLINVANTQYGVTYAGGDHDLGVVFQRVVGNPLDDLTAIHSFDGTDGSRPVGPLAADAAGNLYGVTKEGGPANLGTVFRLSRPAAGGTVWTLTMLHAFTGGTDGGDPEIGLTAGPGGAIYGTTCGGTIFKISGGTSYSVVHIFTSTEGGCPKSTLVFDPAGDIIGSTTVFTAGPGDGGSLFKLDTAGHFTTVAGFQIANGQGSPGLAQVSGNLVRDNAGNVYGMAQWGGATFPQNCCGGAIFVVTAVTHKAGIIYGFPDNTQVSAGGIVTDNAGNFYGTLTKDSQFGAGSVFQVSKAGTFATLATFNPAYQAPVGGLVFDRAGNLYGTTSAGYSSAFGSASCSSASVIAPVGCGTTFEISP